MTYTPAPSTDHVDRGLFKLLEQFKEKAKLAGVLSSYTKQIQKLEDAAWEVIGTVAIDDLEGVALDDLGALLRRGRGNLDDPDYRIALRCQILINRSDGSPPMLQKIAILSVPDGTGLEYDEYYPASFRVKIQGDASGFSVITVWQNLKAAKLGGVRFWLEYGTLDAESTFTLAASTALETSATKGMGDSVAGAIGGGFASVIA